MRGNQLEQIVATLNLNAVRYLVAGGLAVVAHGYVRFTADVDLIIQLEEDNLRRALAALAGLGYRPRAPVPIEAFADAATRNRWVAEKGLTVFSLHSPNMKESEIDIFVEVPVDFERAYKAAARFEVAPGVTATFLGREDIVLSKELAGRPKDLIDVEKLKEIWEQAIETDTTD